MLPKWPWPWPQMEEPNALLVPNSLYLHREVFSIFQFSFFILTSLDHVQDSLILRSHILLLCQAPLLPGLDIQGLGYFCSVYLQRNVKFWFPVFHPDPFLCLDKIQRDVKKWWCVKEKQEQVAQLTPQSDDQEDIFDKTALLRWYYTIN